MEETNEKIYQPKTVKEMTKQELVDRLKQAGFDYQGLARPLNRRGKPLETIISNGRTYTVQTRAMYDESMALLETVNFVENNQDYMHRALSELE
ncbi:MAG TPA: hypothetical protein VJJ21_02495 [Candidatus Nanoarchaeia archaeon]|nr:hypothetical protein [Candidatus Nanoarchaeia archaeon]